MSNLYHVHIGTFTVDFTFDGAGWTQATALNQIRNELAEAARKVTSGSNFAADRLVTHLLRTSNYAQIADTYTSKSYTNILRLTYEAWSYKLTVSDSSGRTNLWQGTLTYFNATQHIKVTPSFSSLKDKVVRFTYNGGSEPQATRLIKVSSYSDGHLHGTDLVKNGIRQFNTAKISELEVVNV